MKEKVHVFLTEFISWVSKQDSILGVSLVGSYARGAARPNSDVDLVILSDKPHKLINDDKWLTNFGKVISIRHEDYGLVQSRHILYEDGLNIEYGITTLQWTNTKPVDIETCRVVTDGMKILYDPDNLFRHLQKAVDCLEENRSSRN